MRPYPRVRVCIDRGGTFTDVYAAITRASGSAPEVHVLKLLSVAPEYPDAPTEGIRRVLALATGERGEGLVETTHLDEVRMGTTVATNALLERDGERCAFVTTEGMGACLEIGNQARPQIFDLKVRKSGVLYESVVEAEERVRVRGGSGDAGADEVVLEVEKVLGEEALRKSLEALYERGVRSLAVAFMHAYGKPEHELLAEKIAKEIGFEHVSVSSNLTPMTKVCRLAG